jgi:hypothetical protein
LPQAAWEKIATTPKTYGRMSKAKEEDHSSGREEAPQVEHKKRRQAERLYSKKYLNDKIKTTPKRTDE